MLTIRNIQFTKLLKAGGRLREFNFRKTSFEGNVFFNVDVTDDRGNRIMFRLQKEENAWKIIPQVLPEWITAIEPNLYDVVEDESNF